MEYRHYLMEKTAPLHLPTTTTNPEGNMEDKVNRREHTRQLLYEVLKERGVKSNSVTGEKIDEKSDIDAFYKLYKSKKRKIKSKAKFLRSNQLLASLQICHPRNVTL